MKYKKLIQLSHKELKEKVKEIRAYLPKEEQNVVTFSKNFTLSLSNYCQNQCAYCFYNYKIQKEDGQENEVLIPDYKINNLIQQAIAYNCKETLLMSGEKPYIFQKVKEELKLRNYNNFIHFVKDLSLKLLNSNLLPHTNIGYLSYNELKELKPLNASMGLMLESTCKKLFKRGGVHEFSPGKIPNLRLEHIDNAGRLKIPFTTGLLLGIGESIYDRINDLLVIKKLHQKYGHIQEVILQNFDYKTGIPFHPLIPIQLIDILKIVGIAKLIFQNEIAIQVAPNLITGYEEEFLEMGITDFGGISPITQDFINPQKPWPEIAFLEKLCNINGFKLKERLPIYEKFIYKPDFCPESIKKTINNIN
ncbi:MAG: 7,8-didemethyl-8-hydroxy-5-deazariboflavin synthase subunit CofG [Candidatus Hodarchaeota archaeon]